MRGKNSLERNLKIFKETFIANAKEFLRDRGALFWMLAFPIIFTVIFGIVFSGGGEISFTVGVVKGNDSPATNQIVESLKQIKTFQLEVGSKEEEMKALEEGNRSLVLILPELSFSELGRGKESRVELYYDATRQNTNQTLISAVKQVFAEMERGISESPKLFAVESRPVQSEQLTNFDYILPGILAMSLMQLGLFGVFQFLNLREKGVLRGLAVTPLPRSAFFESEVLLRLLTAMVQTLLIVVIGKLLFDVRLVGSPLVIAGLVMIGAMTFISMGYMVASFAKTLESGRNIIQLIQFPMMFLSGIFFPIDFMPTYIKPVVKAIPLTYLGDALRQTMVGAPPSHSMGVNLAVLAGWLVVSSVLAIRFWRWE